MAIDRQLFKTSLLWIILIELLSLVSFTYPTLQVVGFLLVLLVTLLISMRNLSLGLYIVFAELIIGSFGQLFSIELMGTAISIRAGLFIVVMAVWLVRLLSVWLEEQRTWWLAEYVRHRPVSVLRRPESMQLLREFFRTHLGRWYGALALVLVWGLIWGLLRNDFQNVFFDFNNWLYFLYILPFWQIFVSANQSKRERSLENQAEASLGGRSDLRNKESKRKFEWDTQSMTSNKMFRPRSDGSSIRQGILTIIAVGVIVLAVKTILLEWLFAHQVPGTIEMLYRWVRDFRLGEVTFFTQNFYRVFLQSQVWLLLGFFVFIPPLLRGGKGGWKQNKLALAVLILSSTSLIISFSRSLWLGLLVGLAIFFVLLLFKLRWPLKRVGKWIASFTGILALELIFIVALINLPPVKDATDFGSLVSDRLTGIEAAGSSRINLLGPLTKEVIKYPIIGSGFGSTVTYTSADPRVLARTASQSGELTTYAFEWSYLDMILKFGLVGLLVYLGLLWQLLKLSWKQIQTIDNSQLTGNEMSNVKCQMSNVLLGLVLALIALLATNITTPYLNHPLGIGFVILMTAVLANNRKALPAKGSGQASKGF